MTGSGLAAQPSQSLENIARGTRRSMGQFIPQYRTARSAHEIMVGDPAEAVERESRGLWGQDRTAVVGAFGVPSVACDREKAGNEGPVLAQKRRFHFSNECPLSMA